LLKTADLVRSYQGDLALEMGLPLGVELQGDAAGGSDAFEHGKRVPGPPFLLMADG